MTDDGFPLVDLTRPDDRLEAHFDLDRGVIWLHDEYAVQAVEVTPVQLRLALDEYYSRLFDRR